MQEADSFIESVFLLKGRVNSKVCPSILCSKTPDLFSICRIGTEFNPRNALKKRPKSKFFLLDKRFATIEPTKDKELSSTWRNKQDSERQISW